MEKRVQMLNSSLTTEIEAGTERRFLVKYFGIVLGAIVLTAGLGQFLSIYMAIATTAYITMLFGVVLRKDKSLHMALMSTAMLTDFLLVLALEFTRSAVNTAVSFEMSLPQQAHIGFSTLAVLLYLPILILGLRRYLAREGGFATRYWHIRLGVAGLVFRSLGFIFMFSLL